MGKTAQYGILCNCSTNFIIMIRIKYVIYFLLFVSIYSCTSSEKNKTTKPKVNLTFPSFSKDSAYLYVMTQVNFGPRVPNTQSHTLCANWFSNKLKSFGADVQIQEFKSKAFTGSMLNGKNIIARFNPNEKTRIVLAAHWDSRPFSDQDPEPSNHKKPVDGADDGASGAGVLLEIGRMIQIQPPKNLGIDIVLFDCEDYGTDNDTYSWGLGAQYWSKEYLSSPFKAKYGILLDMVGSTNPRFMKEGFSVQYAPHIVEKVWALATREGYSSNFVDQHSFEITDDHYFVNTIAKLPMINIINRPEGSPKGFVHHWHTQKDNMNVIDPASLQMVGKILVKLIYREAANDF